MFTSYFQGARNTLLNKRETNSYPHQASVLYFASEFLLTWPADQIVSWRHFYLAAFFLETCALLLQPGLVGFWPSFSVCPGAAALFPTPRRLFPSLLLLFKIVLLPHPGKAHLQVVS